MGDVAYHDFIEDGAVNADKFMWCKSCERWIPPPYIHTCSPATVYNRVRNDNPKLTKMVSKQTCVPKFPKNWGKLRKVKTNKRKAKPSEDNWIKRWKRWLTNIQ